MCQEEIKLKISIQWRWMNFVKVQKLTVTGHCSTRIEWYSELNYHKYRVKCYHIFHNMWSSITDLLNDIYKDIKTVTLNKSCYSISLEN